MGKKNLEKTLADETDKLVHKIIEQGVDAIIGGSPCQDNSIANPAGKGFDGERSGLVWEMVRTLRLVRPKIWLMENVPNSFRRGIQRVFGRLASCGYDAEWDCVSASATGASHHRARTYIFAYDVGQRGERFGIKQIQKQPEFSWLKDVRRFEDLPERCDLYPSKLCRSSNGIRERLDAVGNGNPPCIIREITRGLK